MSAPLCGTRYWGSYRNAQDYTVEVTLLEALLQPCESKVQSSASVASKSAHLSSVARGTKAQHAPPHTHTPQQPSTAAAPTESTYDPYAVVFLKNDRQVRMRARY